MIKHIFFYSTVFSKPFMILKWLQYSEKVDKLVHTKRSVPHTVNSQWKNCFLFRFYCREIYFYRKSKLCYSTEDMNTAKDRDLSTNTIPNNKIFTKYI